MRIVEKKKEMQRISEELRKEGKIIGFVPTMGYLHEGHLSLVDIARKNSDVVVVSIFVNPTQFGPNEDYEEYPRDLERDKKLLEERGCDILFYPSVEEMYPPGFRTEVHVKEWSEVYCGASRPGHFKGVTTVVMKLFHIVKPHLAVFGEKDFQQLRIIERMVEDMDMDIKIIPGKIIREKDGLAMSSRNTYLSPDERKRATVLYRALVYARERIKEMENLDELKKEMREMIEREGGEVDYIVFIDPVTLEERKEKKSPMRCLLAVRMGKARLIDNMEIL